MQCFLREGSRKETAQQAGGSIRKLCSYRKGRSLDAFRHSWSSLSAQLLKKGGLALVIFCLFFRVEKPLQPRFSGRNPRPPGMSMRIRISKQSGNRKSKTGLEEE